jgi:hypothetical protein
VHGQIVERLETVGMGCGDPAWQGQLKVLEVDRQGRIRLSMKAVTEEALAG